MKYLKSVILAAIISLFLFTACEEKINDTRDYPEIETTGVSNITAEGATFSGVIVNAGSSRIIEHGFVWGTNKVLNEPSNDRVYLGLAEGEQTVSFDLRTTLEEGKTYYLSFFVKAEGKMVYGNTVSFVSLGSNGPDVLGFSPDIVRWGDTVSVTGRNFSWTNYYNKVYVGDVEISNFISTSDTLLKFVVPTEVFTKDNAIAVEVTGNRTNYTGKMLTFIQPQIESLLPASAFWGDTVTVKIKDITAVTGTNNINVFIGSLKIVYIYNNSAGQYRFVIPDNLETVSNQLKIIVHSHTLEAATPFTLLPPVIDSISPVSGSWTTILTLYGRFNKNLSGTVVTFGALPGTVQSVSRDSVKVKVPPTLSALFNTLAYKYKSISSLPGPQFSLEAPVIGTVTPMEGFTGDVITITGKNFNQNYTTVKFGSQVAKIQSVSGSQIRCYVPGNYNGQASISVTVGDQTSVYSQPFTLTNPVITSFYPLSASTGDTITITCKDYNSYTDFVVTSDQGYDISLQKISVSGDKIGVVIPDSYYTITSSLIYASVFRDWNESLIPSDEVFTIKMPGISSFSPASGRAGTEVTLTGTNFSDVSEYNKVTIGGVSVTVSSSSRTEIIFNLPLVPQGNYNISVAVSGQSANSAGEFEAISAWSRLPDLGFVNNSFTMDYGNEVYVTAYDNYQTVNLFRFNPTGPDFSPAGSFSNSMYFFGRPVIKGDKVYMLGHTYYEAQFLVFDRSTKTLSKISNTPSAAMLQANLIDGDTVLYAGGGNSSNYSDDLKKEFWKYSLKTEIWTRLNDMPFFSVSSNCFTINGRHFALATDKKLWEYNPSADSWISRSVYPGTGYRGLMNVVCNGKAYLGHGTYGDNELYSYDPVTDAWSPLHDELPVHRAFPFAFQSGGKIYFGGGDSNRTDFWMYDPSKE